MIPKKKSGTYEGPEQASCANVGVALAKLKSISRQGNEYTKKAIKHKVDIHMPEEVKREDRV